MSSDIMRSRLRNLWEENQALRDYATYMQWKQDKVARLSFEEFHKEVKMLGHERKRHTKNRRRA